MLRPEIAAKLDELEILSTPQRLEIAEILLERPQHLSAEHIIDRLRASGSGVSKATVYNTLKLFTERGLVRECVVDPERRFYDSTIEPHHHFYNLDTGELTDIPAESIRIEGLPQFPENGELDSVEVVIRFRRGSAEKPV
ncbi:MAG: transcriptional repressor [Gammaproteobacteria bacterium]|nr:transcriptional repressor [Gammaproteobacteria bacterium]MDH5617427.1 transcriptional repressor [Gammaproteobacteria bacterium]